ncbi:MAG: hypothetical protein R3B45_05325 [Bdellovibrionota bacterium]
METNMRSSKKIISLLLSTFVAAWVNTSCSNQDSSFAAKPKSLVLKVRKNSEEKVDAGAKATGTADAMPEAMTAGGGSSADGSAAIAGTGEEPGTGSDDGAATGGSSGDEGSGSTGNVDEPLPGSGSGDEGSTSGSEEGSSSSNDSGMNTDDNQSTNDSNDGSDGKKDSQESGSSDVVSEKGKDNKNKGKNKSHSEEGEGDSSGENSTNPSKEDIAQCAKKYNKSPGFIKIVGNKSVEDIEDNSIIAIKMVGNKSRLNLKLMGEEGTKVVGLCIFAAGNSPIANINVVNVELSDVSFIGRGNGPELNMNIFEGAKLSGFSADLKGNGSTVNISGKGNFDCASADISGNNRGIFNCNMGP